MSIAEKIFEKERNAPAWGEAYYSGLGKDRQSAPLLRQRSANPKRATQGESDVH